MAAAPVELPPADVAERLFGVDVWDTPRAILDAVFRPHARVAVKACHASSKTHSAALAILLALYEGGDVLTTAPTWAQVQQVLWGELHRILFRSVIPAKAWGEINLTEIRMPTGGFALGLSTNETVRFQGFHAREGSFLLVVMDEAPGVLPGIYEAVEGISAGGDVRLLFLGNPVISSGPFYDIFAGDVPGWDRFTIDAFDTPNLRGLSLDDLLALPEHELERNERPYLVTRRWVRDRYHEWGEDHPLWQSRVRGRFPLQAPDALLSLAWLEAAKARAIDREAEHAISAGIDVAGPGDNETVLYLRRGDDVLGMVAWAEADPREQVVKELESWLHLGLKRVNVDAAGIGWYFFCDLRARLAPFGVDVWAVNVGEASRELNEFGEKRFANLKAELYWHLRGVAASGDLAGLTDQTTIAQLAGIKYAMPRGVITIEEKERARKRGVASPDRAEALVLAFARVDSGRQLLSSLYGVSVPMRVGR